MEAQRRRSVIMLIFFCYAASCLNFASSSSSAQVRTRDGNPDRSISSNIQSFCTSEQYIMQSYFDSRSSLDDSEFWDFLFHRGSCEIPPEDPSFFPVTVSLLQRNITGEGLHRHLLTSISLHQSPSRFREVVIVERLPLGVFADPFELQNLQKCGVFSDVAVFGDTNLEMPSFRSNRSVVEIHMEINSEDLQNVGISLKLPLHARYQPLEDRGYSRVEFREPDVFICWSRQQNRRRNSTRCLVLSIGESKPEIGSAVWEIPAGIKVHTEIVSIVTFVSAVFSAVSILVASFFSSNAKLCKNSKKS